MPFIIIFIIVFSTIKLFLAPMSGRTNKHIHIPEHYIHEAVDLEIKLYYLPTDL